MTRSRRRRFSELAGLALLFVILGAGRARAQQPDPAQVKAYREHVSQAESYWEAENYPAARAEYQKAYSIQPRPILLFNIASTYRREANVDKAMSYYQQFLDVAPADHEYRSLAEEAIEFLKDLKKKKQQEESAAAIEASAGGAGAAAGGQRDGEAAPGRAFVYAGIAAGAAGVLAVGYGLFEGKRALDRESELESLDAGHMWTEEDQRRFDEGEMFERRAIIASIVGAAAIATGATLFVVGYRKGQEVEDRSLSLLPYTGESEAGLALVGRF